MKSHALALLIAAFALAAPSLAHAQSVVTDDASVTAGAAGNASLGKLPTLTVAGGRTTYLKFDLSSLAASATAGSAVQRATLQLYVGNVIAPGRVDLFAVEGAWDEATITADTAPPPAFLVTTVDRIGPEAQLRFLTVDVTSLVRQWLGDDGAGRNGVPNEGIAIAARAEDGEVVNVAFDSKENAQTGHEPRLLIQLATANGVTGVTADAPIFVENGATAPHLTLGTVRVFNGGTGLASSGAAGSFLRSTGAAWASAPLSAGDVPPGSGAYIQNGVAPQAASNFNVTGVGTAAVLNAITQVNLAGERVLSNPGNSNLFVGRNTGTAGAANTFVGNNAGSQNTTAIRNTFVGADAGRFDTSGGQNTFVGTDAGKFNTEGFFDVFMGESAGGVNTTGCCDTFVGAFAGSANTTGFRNVFVGVQAGLSNTTASSNTFVGTESGKLNTTGEQNSYFGDLAGVVSTTGSRNALFGFRTGQHIDTGSENAFFGELAGDQTVAGNGNTFIGRGAASRNSDGNDNTFVGSFADFTGPNATGSGNTAIGAGAAALPDLTNASAIGSRAQAAVSNAIVLGAVNGVNGATADTSVGIGTTKPREKLDVTGGNIFLGSPGRGVILRSPSGAVCRLLSIDDGGNLVTAAIACPADVP